MPKALTSTPEDVPHASPFEQAKRIDDEGSEFWSARDLMPLLDYSTWRNFSSVCLEVYTSLCLENSTQIEMIPAHKTILIGSGASRKIKDWQISLLALERILSRAASHKPAAIHNLRSSSNASFRIETHIGAILLDFCNFAGLSLEHQKRLEKRLFDYCIEDRLLIEIDEVHHQIDSRQRENDAYKNELAARYGYTLLRITMPTENIATLLGSITEILFDIRAKKARIITPEDFAIFQDHGYKGLYGGLAAKDIHRRKKLKKTQNILDHMGSTELAANWFRSTQAEDKLRQDNIQGKENANQVHHAAGIMVRRFIQEFGGTMPENLPTPESSIKTVERKEKKRLHAPRKKDTASE